MGKTQLHMMFLRFFPDRGDLAEQFATLCDGEGLSMAELQGFFMFFKDKPQDAAANVQPWLEARREAHAEQLQNQAAETPAEPATTKSNAPPTETTSSNDPAKSDSARKSE